ncbi:hypothetical protein N658DRAFT_567046 [Parathielavia hyrcaniae]|uniref:Uncharacterized protein n=1 Tax=Parathielavia hyrcaniae TaxID=113614 RepID=A0AAN6PZW1_9PEZI|nr:hypothetical protein N658DRAFT_567046 [Parathielavia hyrcaniae]
MGKGEMELEIISGLDIVDQRRRRFLGGARKGKFHPSCILHHHISFRICFRQYTNIQISIRRTSRHSREGGWSSGASELGTPEDAANLDWHAAWLSAQHAKLPATATGLPVFGRSIRNSEAFGALCELIERYARDNRGFSVDEVIEYLDSEKSFEDAVPHTWDSKRLLVFAILGWHQLAIHHDAGNPDSGLVFDEYIVLADMCDRPLHVLLKSFGNLLPARASNTALAAVESSKAAASWTALYPSELNAYLLHALLRVRFRWVDSLALHLDYDRSTRTLSLFSFPSICISQLRERSGTIFAFASTELQPADPRADENDIAHLLEEVLLSFRLLFGQSAKSRKLFRHIFNPAEAPFPQPDLLLPLLFSEKQPFAGAAEKKWTPRDRRVYYAARDFPVLYERIELLAKELNGVKPKSMGNLLRDRRDTAFLDVILQAIQLAQGA